MMNLPRLAVDKDAISDTTHDFESRSRQTHTAMHDTTQQQSIALPDTSPTFSTADDPTRI